MDEEACTRLVGLLASDPQLVISTLKPGINLVQFRNGQSKWKCHRCGKFVLGGAENAGKPMALHVCGYQHAPKLDGCMLCNRRHTCTHRIWRWRLMDWTALPETSLQHLEQEHGKEYLRTQWSALYDSIKDLSDHIMGCVTCVLPTFKEVQLTVDSVYVVDEQQQQQRLITNHLLILPNKHGRGLYAAHDISEGQPICVYSGSMVAHLEAAEPDDGLLLLTASLQVSKRRMTKVTWDPRNVGGVAWLANSAHGHSANMSMYTAVLRGDPKTAAPVGLLVAKRDIPAGEELRWCYNAITECPEEVMACKCDDPACDQQLVRLWKAPRKRRRNT